MLSHIFRNQFIQNLRRKGCSKKQATKIHDKFVANLWRGRVEIKDLANYALMYGSQFNHKLISGAFLWDKSPQGYEYWKRVREIYEKYPEHE